MATFQDSNIFSNPHIIFFFRKSPKLHVASDNACRHFRRFQVLFSKPILLYGFHGATFSKVSRESRNFPMVNLKFTGSTYSLYLCINVLLTKFSLQKTSSFPYKVMLYLLVFLIIKHLICLRSKTISDHPFRKQDYP